MKSKKIIILIVVLLIGLVIFMDLMFKWKEINFRDMFVTANEIEMDLDGDGVNENIQLYTYGRYITINGTDYVVNKYAREDINENNYNLFKDYKNSYLFMDINQDGLTEIILNASTYAMSPISRHYKIYHFNKVDLKEVGNFSVTGDAPEKIYVKGKWIKFKYSPYETIDDKMKTVICRLDI